MGRSHLNISAGCPSPILSGLSLLPHDQLAMKAAFASIALFAAGALAQNSFTINTPSVPTP